MRDLIIVRLNPDSSHAATVASWTYAEWGHLNPVYTDETWREAFRRECGEGGVPSVFVAVQGDQQGLYCRFGWRDHEALSYRGEEATIMLRRLEA